MLRRLRHILKRHGTALLQPARQRDSMRLQPDCTAESLLLAFAEADPSHNKSATQWLVQTYLRSGFRLEDLVKARETLTWFGLYRRRLPETQRDFNRYRTLAGVWMAVAALVEAGMPPSLREEDRREREAAMAETDIVVQREDGFTVAVPLSMRASQWWGRGTRWCTAAEHGNAFESYNATGPLFVLVMPDGAKYQAYADCTTGSQLADAADDTPSMAEMERYWREFEPILELMVSYDGNALQFVHQACMTFFGTAASPVVGSA